jgi:hypothetical protein
MSNEPKPALKSLIADKAALRRILEEQDKRTGFVPDPTVTPERLREMMIADGVRPEDNIGSREIIRMREGDEPDLERKEDGSEMETGSKPDLKSLLVDKAALRKILEEQDKRTGFVPDPTATPQKAQQMSLADGVRPEENIASREIIRMREGDEE